MDHRAVHRLAVKVEFMDKFVVGEAAFLDLAIPALGRGFGELLDALFAYCRVVGSSERYQPPITGYTTPKSRGPLLLQQVLCAFSP